MNVAIIGSRKCGKFSVSSILNKLPENCTLIVSGGAKGIDSIAKQAALQANIPFIEILPNYKLYGKRATLVRNKEIVQKVDQVLAFWDFNSRGTAHTIAQCVALNVAVQVFGLED